MSNYRIVRIAGVHFPASVATLYAADPELAQQPYAVQQKALFAAALTYADSFAAGMRRLGHDARELIYDVGPLQRRWAAENSAPYAPDRWQTDIVLRQIETLRPDIVYFQDVYALPHEVRRGLKATFPFLRAVAVYKGFPTHLDQLDGTDALFVGTPLIGEQFRRAGHRPHLVYHAFDPSVLNLLELPRQPASVHAHGLTFSGSSGHGYGGHRGRFWMLVELCRRTDIALWVDDREDGPKDGLDKLPGPIREALVEYEDRCGPLGPLPPQPIRTMFPEHCHPPVYGLEMFRLLRESEVVFNRHTDAAIDHVGNMRLFQATGVGTCLLTEDGVNLADLFEPDREVVVYHSTEECIEKANYLLTHRQARQAVAAAGMRRTLRDHTVADRCARIDDVLQKLL